MLVLELRNRGASGWKAGGHTCVVAFSHFVGFHDLGTVSLVDRGRYVGRALDGPLDRLLVRLYRTRIRQGC